MSYIFQHATIIDPVQNLNQKGSLKLSDQGIIEKINFSDDPIKPDPHDNVFDFTGKVIAPGFLDMHVHFREPGEEYKEDIENGIQTAIKGGFTTVAVMPNTFPPTDNAQAVAFIQKKASGKIVDVLPIGTITRGRKGEKIADYGELKEEGVLAISDDGSPVMSSFVMRLAFEYASSFDLLLIQHCEDCALSAGGVMNESVYSSILGLKGVPSISESIILSRDLELIRYLNEKKGNILKYPIRYHVAHVSTKESIQLIREAKKEGLNVSTEVTPHHFTLTDEDVFKSNYDGNYRMNPPLRSQSDKEAILEGIADGTIDCIATDHAPHTLTEKECGFSQAPFGIIGLETAVGLAQTELVNRNVISFDRLIAMYSTNPRKLMSLPEISLKEGEQANLTFIDPQKEWTIQRDDFQSRSKNTPFDKKILKGKAIGLVNKGSIILF